MIKHVEFTSDSRKLLFYEQDEDDLKLRDETMTEIFDDEIDIIWLPVVGDEPNGYAKLQLLSRLLAGNPDNEEVYALTGAVMDSAPEEYPVEEKIRYLTALKAIKGIDDDLLEKYGLLIVADNK